MNTILTTEEERMALRYDPFADDCTQATRIASHFVTSSRHWSCFYCLDVIKPGERHRLRTDRNDETTPPRLMSWRWCPECCKAMATSWDDPGPLQQRYDYGADLRLRRHARSLAQKRVG